MKKILIIGAGEMQLDIIKKVNEKGLYSIAVDYDENAPGFEYASEKALISTNDSEAILKFAKNAKIDGILTTSDYPVRVVSKVAKELFLPAMSEAVAEICTNKYLQRNFLLENNLNVPYYTSELETDLTNFPYIVKPIDSSASRGVKLVHTVNELSDAILIAKNNSKTGKYIIEEYIEGREFSVETLTQNFQTVIVAITEKQIINPQSGYFVENAHIQPANLDKKEFSIIKSEVLKAIKLLNLNNCPTHTEVKLKDHNCYIIEIACRLGGDYITSHLVPLSTGISMLDNLINLSIGEFVDLERKFENHAAVQFLNRDNYHNVVSFLKHNQNNKAIIDYQIKEYVDKEIKSSLDRLGHIIIQCSTRNEINDLLAKINGK